MKWLVFASACLSTSLIANTSAVGADGDSRPAAAATGQTLQDVQAFAAIRDRRERSLALFVEAGKVIESPRCLNCHPVTARPTQTDGAIPHQPVVTRGPDGFGRGGMRCSNCHQAENYDVSGVPGSPKWHLAPAVMGWQGKSLGQICRQIKDPTRNGGLDMAGLVRHMGDDPLVGWAWKPGGDRTPAPGSQEGFGKLIAAWAKTGGHCPDD